MGGTDGRGTERIIDGTAGSYVSQVSSLFRTIWYSYRKGTTDRTSKRISRHVWSLPIASSKVPPPANRNTADPVETVCPAQDADNRTIRAVLTGAVQESDGTTYNVATQLNAFVYNTIVGW